MKRIHFEKVNNWKNIVLVSLAMICILVGLWDISSNVGNIWNSRISGLGYLLMVILLAKMFVRKYYVGWNQLGITIKVNSILGSSFKFSEISRTELQDGLLRIVKKDGKRLEYDLSGVENTDIEKLHQLLIEHSRPNNS